MSTLKNKIRAIAGFAVLFVPAMFLLLLHNCGENKFYPLPIYGNRSISDEGDTIYHQLPDYQFTNQLGKTYGTDSLRGGIHVANFIFTTCTGICPKMSSNFQHLQGKISKFSDVKLVSISVDPERDSVAALKLYAEKFNANDHYWKFLTAPQEQIVNIASKGYFLPLDVSGSGKEFGITHSEMAVLVDKNLRIRGYYDITDPKSIKTLEEDIKILKFEYSNPDKIFKR